MPAGSVMREMQHAAVREDRLRRFVPTPLSAVLRVMGRTLSLETNSATVLSQARQVFEPYGAASPEGAEFVWRIVCENDADAGEEWPPAHVLACESLRLVHFGARGFLAVDLEAKLAVGHVAERLTRDEAAFRGRFLAALFESTAPALRLTELTAACLSLAGKGLLLFGPSGREKTEASRLAARLGLELHSDQATFVEVAGRCAQAWGQFWPAVARPPAESVTPVLSIFLEPEDSQVPRLTPLPTREYSRRLQEEVLAGGAGRMNPEGEAVARALSGLPAYRMAYGSDPSRAAIFLHSLLKTHNLLEAHP